MKCVESVLGSLDPSSHKYEVSYSEFHEGCFEADIVIRTRAGTGTGEETGTETSTETRIETETGTDKSALIYNIEIDDKSIGHQKRNSLCAYRDEYLEKACGIQVLRVENPRGKSQGVGDAEVEAVVRRALSQLNILD